MTTLTEHELTRVLRSNPDVTIHGDGYQKVVDVVMGAAKTGKRDDPEHRLQAAIIAKCNEKAESDPRWGYIYAIPNGGQRSKAVAGKLKAEGVKSGVPDLFLPVAAHGMHGLYIECKCDNNKQTVSQAAWAKILIGQGYCYEVIYDNPQDAINVLAWYLGSQP